MGRPICQRPPRKFPWPSPSAFSRVFVLFLLFWRFGGDLTAGAGGGGLRDFESQFGWHAKGVQCQPRAVAPHLRRRLERSYKDHGVSGQPASPSAPAARALCSRAAATSKQAFQRSASSSSSSSVPPFPVTQGLARTFQKRPDTKRELCSKLQKLLGRYGILS